MKSIRQNLKKYFTRGSEKDKTKDGEIEGFDRFDFEITDDGKVKDASK